VETEDRVVYLPTKGRRFIDPGMDSWRNRADVFAQARMARSGWRRSPIRAHHSRLGDRALITEVKSGMDAADRQEGSLWIASLGDGLAASSIYPDPRTTNRTVRSEAEQFTEKDGLLSTSSLRSGRR